ncbi:hypothetical protein Sarmat_00754 [Rickettsiales endosymbiont of Paramecium tredecaurelia]|uniref:zinc-ribbon domain-containing protein n=1 Tax=Candidatus Sarmatiella mevalonica TaxID=2770581 RepID=UPI0019205806|nr:zinc-ribbon domain-containing protein [Candidatus Sarmatiella mevalonica]MBL3284895.1 hypothetical protein [Candidatus Sarmatiella mevalonica]
MNKLLIDCPNCDTSFEVVTDGNIDGRKLRCSECRYVWLFHSATEVIDEEEESGEDDDDVRAHEGHGQSDARQNLDENLDVFEDSANQQDSYAHDRQAAQSARFVQHPHGGYISQSFAHPLTSKEERSSASYSGGVSAHHDRGKEYVHAKNHHVPVNSLSSASNNKHLSKRVYDEQTQGSYEAQNAWHTKVREDSRINSDAQLPSGVEFGVGSIEYTEVDKVRTSSFQTIPKRQELLEHTTSKWEQSDSAFAFQDVAYRKQKITLPITQLPEQKNTSYLLYLTTVVLLAFITAIVLFGFRDWYLADVTLSSKINLSLSDVQMINQDNKLTILSKIINNSSKVDAVPLVRIRLLDHKDRVVEQKLLNYQQIALQPGQEFNIKIDFDCVTQKIKYADVSIGSKWDFLVR